MNKIMAIIMVVFMILMAPVFLLLWIAGEIGRFIEEIYGDGHDWYWAGRD